MNWKNLGKSIGFILLVSIVWAAFAKMIGLTSNFASLPGTFIGIGAGIIACIWWPLDDL